MPHAAHLHVTPVPRLPQYGSVITDVETSLRDRLVLLPPSQSSNRARFVGLPRHGRWALLVAVTLVILADAALRLGDADGAWRTALVSLTMLVATGLFAWWPAAAAVCLLLVTLVQTTIGYQGTEFLHLAISSGLVVYTAPVWFVLVYVSVSSGLAMLAATTTEIFADGALTTLGLVLALSVLIGSALRRAHGREHRLALDNERLRHDREAELTAERSRITDELHDIIARDITLVSMHVRVLERVTDPGLRRKSLAVIRSSADQALADIRRLLHVMNESDAPPESVDAPMALSEVLINVEQELTDLGARVDIHVDGGLTGSTSVEHALARMLREATTNIVKHGAERPDVTIELVGDEHQIRLRLRNTVRQPPERDPSTSSSGYGLALLEERITVLGGTLLTAHEGEEFVIHAALPRI